MLTSMTRRLTLAAALVSVGFGPGCGGGEAREAPPEAIAIPPESASSISKNAPKRLPSSGEGSGSQADPNVSR